MEDDDSFKKVHDLNSFVIFITRFYSFIFDRLKRKFPKSRLNSWVEAFVVSSDLESKGDLSLKKAIADIMKNEAGISIDEWSELQQIRRLRNSICHPTTSSTKAREALRERWNEHKSFSALDKMLRMTSRLTNHTPPRTPISSIPTTNWRRRSPVNAPSPLRKCSKITIKK